LYAKDGFGIPGLVFYNVDEQSLSLGPGYQATYYRAPVDDLARPLKAMGVEYNTGTCKADNAWSGCPFNMALVSTVHKYTFKNAGWDTKWYPFDTRNIYISMLSLHPTAFSYNFPTMPSKVQFTSSSGWDATSTMSCVAKKSVSEHEPLFLRATQGFVCSFEASRHWMNPMTSVCLPLLLATITVWMTFFAPVGAAMPRVAVTALAYVGMGSTFNHLGTILPGGSEMCWIQYLVLIQLLICVEGTSCHLLLFYFADGKHPHLVHILNTSMRWFIPMSWGASFVLATITVLNQLGGLLIIAVVASLPAISICGPFCPPDKPTSVTAPLSDGQQGPGIHMSSTPGLDPDDMAGESGKEFEAAMARLESGDFNELFQRYDLDESGFIDSREELTQLTMAVIYRLGLDKEPHLTKANLVAHVDLKVNEAFQASKASESAMSAVIWSQQVAQEWLARNILQ